MTGAAPSYRRNAFRFLIGAAGAWTLVVALTGGIDLRPSGIPIKSTEADRPALACLALVLVYAAAYRGGLREDASLVVQRARHVSAWLERRAARVALAAAVAMFGVGITVGIHVAGGSDSYGYISQARLWLRGDPLVEQPIARSVPWPDADWTFTPLAYRPAQQPGAIVPVYAPGLGVLMALGEAVIGRCGPFVVVPLLAGWLVWMTYRLGTLAWSPLAGLFAALALATSPLVGFMTLNPMSDVPAAAFLVGGLVLALSPGRARAFWTGVVVGLAVLVRPNLVPLGAIHLGCLLARMPRAEWWRTVIGFGLGGAPGVAAVGATNAALYGAPWNAGYGSLAEMYAWGYLGQNIRQYLAWLMGAETPLVLLSVAAITMLWRADARRRLAVRVLACFTAGVWISYLFYTPFDVWWYLRFLLPAIPALWVLAAMAGAILLARFAGPQRAAAVGLLLAVPFLAFRIEGLRRARIFESRISGVSYLSAAAYIRTTLPENAVILTVLHSGSVRYYTNRLTMRWDLLSAEWWPRALEVLVERGYRPYLLVMAAEEPQLRQRFALGDAPDAPGTLVAEMTAPEALRLYDPLRQTAAPAGRIPAVDVCPCGLDAPPAPD